MHVSLVSFILCESTSNCFQPGEDPSRGLLQDYEPSCGPSFEALIQRHAASCPRVRSLAALCRGGDYMSRHMSTYGQGPRPQYGRYIYLLVLNMVFICYTYLLKH